MILVQTMFFLNIILYKISCVQYIFKNRNDKLDYQFNIYFLNAWLFFSFYNTVLLYNCGSENYYWCTKHAL